MIDEQHPRAKSCYAFQEGMISSCHLKRCEGCDYHVPHLSTTGRPRKWNNRLEMRRSKHRRCTQCGVMKPWCLCYAAGVMQRYNITLEELKPLLPLSSRERKLILDSRHQKTKRKRGRPRE